MEEMNPKPKIYTVTRYEDDKGHVINMRREVSTFGMSTAITAPQFFGVAQMQHPNGSLANFSFRIEAVDIADAFERMDAAAKVEFESRMKEAEAAQRKASIIQSACQPVKPLRFPMNGR